MTGCIYKRDDAKCDKPGRYLSPCIGEACQHQTPSNYDRLISYTPEEMAEMIAETIDCSVCKSLHHSESDECPSNPHQACPDYWLEWLKSPAKEAGA